MRRTLLTIVLLSTLTWTTQGQQSQPSIKLGILDFGSSSLGKLSAQTLRSTLRANSNIQLIDPDLSAAAAKGVGYAGSLNMSVTEAKDLGTAIGSEFFIIGDAQTLRRSSSTRPVYYEAYSSLLIISSRTGRLIYWDRLNAESDNATDAENKLSKALATTQTADRCLEAIKKAQLEERDERAVSIDANVPVVEDAPDDEKTATAQGLRLPRPYRRLRPPYPESAARAEAEGTVDVLVGVGADGEISEIKLARWAGFGLDETTVATVRQLHFFPAMRDGKPIPMRVLLRYNFRKPSQ
jgi:TonB family protein